MLRTQLLTITRALRIIYKSKGYKKVTDENKMLFDGKKIKMGER